MGVALFGLAPLRRGRGGRCARRWPDARAAGSCTSSTRTSTSPTRCAAPAGWRRRAVIVEEGDALAAEKGAPRRWLMMLRAELAFEAGEWEAAEAALPSPGRPAMGTTFINDSLRRIELALGRGDHDVARAAARRGRRRRRRHARAAVDRPAGLAARGARAPHRRPRRGPRGDRRRARPARLLLAGRRPDGPRGRDRRARRGRRRRAGARPRRGPVVRGRHAPRR